MGKKIIKNNSNNPSRKKDNSIKKNIIEKSQQLVKLTRIDWIIMLSITVVYAIIAFYDLGDKEAPQSFWETREYYTNIDIELPEGTTIGTIDYYLGNYEERKFAIYVSDKQLDDMNMAINEETGEASNEGVERLNDAEMNSVFCWASWDIYREAKYLRLVSNSDCCVIGELVIKDTDGNIVKPVNADDELLKGLFDEQEKLPAEFSFRNSTYFDEIYHARTAYEYMNGLYSYENTHPPLGKIFIALGMMIFGVCPFGWRFSGTVFGILMVPCIYLFAKQLFKKTNITGRYQIYRA